MFPHELQPCESPEVSSRPERNPDNQKFGARSCVADLLIRLRPVNPSTAPAHHPIPSFQTDYFFLPFLQIISAKSLLCS